LIQQPLQAGLRKSSTASGEDVGSAGDNFQIENMEKEIANETNRSGFGVGDVGGDRGLCRRESSTGVE
jgi:hypothetical protein